MTDWGYWAFLIIACAFVGRASFKAGDAYATKQLNLLWLRSYEKGLPPLTVMAEVASRYKGKSDA